jgi:hypothetical protein
MISQAAGALPAGLAAVAPRRRVADDPELSKMHCQPAGLKSIGGR